MKRIIAFVLLGLLIYAGVFVIYYSAVDIKINNTTPVTLENIAPKKMRSGLVVEGSIYQVIDKVYTKKVQSKLFGIPIGEAVEQNFYVLPLESSDMFMVIAASDEKDIEALEQLKTDKPRERRQDDPVLEVYGITEEIAPFVVGDFDLMSVKNFLLEHSELIGYTEDVFGRPLESVAGNYVVPYTLYVKHPGGADYVSLIVGIAMCVVGIALAVLLILRIKDEREGY